MDLWVDWCVRGGSSGGFRGSGCGYCLVGEVWLIFFSSLLWAVVVVVVVVVVMVVVVIVVVCVCSCDGYIY